MVSARSTFTRRISAPQTMHCITPAYTVTLTGHKQHRQVWPAIRMLPRLYSVRVVGGYAGLCERGASLRRAHGCWQWFLRLNNRQDHLQCETRTIFEWAVTPKRPRKLYEWRITRIRAAPLGYVEAPDEAEAIREAIRRERTPNAARWRGRWSA